MSHTKGPWFFDGYHIMSTEPGIAIHSVIDDLGMSKEDMILCAAAPEMLEALELLKGYICEVGNSNPKSRAALNVCEAAIKKAKGEL